MMYLWVQGSIPGPDHLFQAHSIRGLCQADASLLTIVEGIVEEDGEIQCYSDIWEAIKCGEIMDLWEG